VPAVCLFWPSDGISGYGMSDFGFGVGISQSKGGCEWLPHVYSGSWEGISGSGMGDFGSGVEIP